MQTAQLWADQMEKAFFGGEASAADFAGFIILIQRDAIQSAANVASRFSVDGKTIHPDVEFKAMSQIAQSVCHTTCQCVAQDILDNHGMWLEPKGTHCV